jgi:hypothetical protein
MSVELTSHTTSYPPVSTITIDAEVPEELEPATEVGDKAPETPELTWSPGAISSWYTVPEIGALNVAAARFCSAVSRSPSSSSTDTSSWYTCDCGFEDPLAPLEPRALSPLLSPFEQFESEVTAAVSS